MDNYNKHIKREALTLLSLFNEENARYNKDGSIDADVRMRIYLRMFRLWAKVKLIDDTIDFEVFEIFEELKEKVLCMTIDETTKMNIYGFRKNTSS